MSFFSEALKQIRSDISQPFEYSLINFGGKAVYVEGFIRVINISDERIEFLCKKCVLAVVGERLSISEISAGTAMVEGEIYGCNRS